MSTETSGFAAEVKRAEVFNIEACEHCVICNAVCPVGYDALPRKLFGFVLEGKEEMARRHTKELYSCLLCRMCEEHCPADVPITDNIRRLRVYLNKQQFKL